MARPRLAVGEWGRVAVTAQTQDDDGTWRTAPSGARKADRWRARAKVRDSDGKVRDVERYGPTKASAERILTEALRERVLPAPADAVIKPTTTVRQAAETWRAEVTESGRLTATTLRVYGSTLRKHIIGTDDEPSPIAALAVAEVRVSHVDRLLRSVSKDHGPGASKMTRSVLRAVLDLAARHDAIPVNPVRSVGNVSSVKDRRETTRDTERAFTRDERDAVVALADTQECAVKRDLGDLVAFMAGTGARLGEACALRWSSLDLADGVARVGPVVVRIKGEGLRINEAGKTASSERAVKLPSWLVARLLERQVSAVGNEWDVVFPSPLGRLRDPSNTGHHVRDLFSDAGHPWATGHTFRKTVATLLDDAGVSARQIATQLGHSRPSMTTDVYMSRTGITEQAAVVL
jgi:integrase